MVYVKDELFHLLKWLIRLSFLRMLLLCYSILSLKMCPNFAFLQHLKSSPVFFPALTEPWATRRRKCTASTRPSSTSRRRSPEPTGPRVSQIPRPHFFPSSPCYPLSFGLSFSAAHLRADWLPMIGARQPSGLNNWLLLTAAYPTEGRSKHDEGWGSSASIFLTWAFPVIFSLYIVILQLKFFLQW